MFNKLCIRCQVPFGSINKKGTICGACLKKRTREYENTPLRELTSPALKYRNEIDSAKDLLTLMGYDVEGDVHIQFLERARSRYGATF